MRALVLTGLLALASLVVVGSPAGAHNPDCFLTSHTLLDVHIDCKATKDDRKHYEWCVLSVDYGMTRAHLLCDTKYAEGNPFR